MNSDYRLSSYHFDLPEDLIAQYPAAQRDQSRMMVLPKSGEGFVHRRFLDVERLFEPGDLLVINDSKVIRARLIGRRASGGRVELLLLEPQAAEKKQGGSYHQVWSAFARPAARLKTGEVLEGWENLELIALRRKEERWIFELRSKRPIAEAVSDAGFLPLPPYIYREKGPLDEDEERYQTVYASKEGSVAAPTAGLHFTEALLARLMARGVSIGRVTLHVGAGTFAPVRHEDIREHPIHSEPFAVPLETLNALSKVRTQGGRIIAVGTTSVRVLETIAPVLESEQGFRDGEDGEAIVEKTSLFIYPGFRFRLVDVMITNFHLPRSSLLMLVSAFAGRERIMRAYAEAVEHRYRFFSFGDCQWIERLEQKSHGKNDV